MPNYWTSNKKYEGTVNSSTRYFKSNKQYGTIAEGQSARVWTNAKNYQNLFVQPSSPMYSSINIQSIVSRCEDIYYRWGTRGYYKTIASYDATLNNIITTDKVTNVSSDEKFYRLMFRYLDGQTCTQADLNLLNTIKRFKIWNSQNEEVLNKTITPKDNYNGVGEDSFTWDVIVNSGDTSTILSKQVYRFAFYTS